MGFGYGQTTYWREEATGRDGGRVAKVLSGDMVAHVWNAESQSFGRTSNGNFAFVGDTLYSYGRKWIVAKLWQGAALINTRKISVTTSSHESAARHASDNRTQYLLPDFPDRLAMRLDSIAENIGFGRKANAKDIARRLFADMDCREALKATPAGRYVESPTESRPWNMEYVPSDAPPLGAFIAESVGLKAAAYHNAAAKLDRAAAKRQAEKEREEQRRFVEKAKRYADMPDSDFRSQISTRDSYHGHAVISLAKELRRYRLKAGLSDKRRRVLLERERKARAVYADFERLHAIAAKRSRLASLVRYVRQHSTLLAIDNGRPLGVWSAATWRTLGNNLVELSACAMLPAGSRVRLARIGEACKAEAYNAECREAEERRREREDREALIAEKTAAWIAGEEVAMPRSLGRFSRDDGTPYLRVHGNELQTSWGASVPLSHAIKVYRFVKLCRERGESWHRNGKTIRVGHFQVDSVAANGDFVAGCHRFAWEEIQRAAAMAGVVEMDASAEAVEESN